MVFLTGGNESIGNQLEKVTPNWFPFPCLGANSEGGLAVIFKRRPQWSDLQMRGPTSGPPGRCALGEAPD